MPKGISDAVAMDVIRGALVLLLINSAFFVASGVQSGRAVDHDGDGKKVYIVFTQRQPKGAWESDDDIVGASSTIESFHHRLLSDALDSSSGAPERVVYHYTRSLHGFAARLTEQEKNNLAGKDGILSIHERVVYSPQTTRSWDFLGLPVVQEEEHSKRLPMIEQDVIIGMIDTGISAESASFSDDGLAPPPAKWKGRCSKYIKCNNKIIGAWSYYGGYPDGQVKPVDTQGHGTHTASIAAGRAVRNASLYGVANGVARGATPGARLAIYKVCWDGTCASEDILAAMDDAIADGVDVISVSIATSSVLEYSDDALAIAAFHAVRRGVLTSVAAGGNCGPTLGTVTNVAPWMISVAATNTDRKIFSKVILGNGKHFMANSINTFPDTTVKRALIVDPGNWENLQVSRYKGAILLWPSEKSLDEHRLFRTGAAGVIFPAGDTTHDHSRSYSIPAAVVTLAQFHEILHYYNTTRHPVVSIWNSQTVFDAEAPVAVPAFSSRGPNLLTPGILKPDISAPGVEILAAWSPRNVVSMSADDDRQVPYNIVSGTSVATPHVTGAAAYVKAAHPDWSPAAIISSLVTSATPILGSNDTTISEAEFAYGAGMVNPAGAVNSGLVYDASEADYISFLCAQGYNATQMTTITGKTSTCSSSSQLATISGISSSSLLNYPSISVPVPNYGVSFSTVIPRAATNVGPVDSVYRIKISSAPGISISVEPEELVFSAAKKRISFTVTVSGTLSRGVGDRLGASASIVWSDGKHQQVRSPVYVFPQQLSSYTSTDRCRCKPVCFLYGLE